jgi:hypothetical protein
MTDRLVAALAEVIWVASRKDEGTISATGANIVARALIDHFGLVEEWGVRFERQADPTMGNPSGVVTVEQTVSNEATARGAVKNGAPISAKNRRVVRRLVSRWVEVEP